MKHQFMKIKCLAVVWMFTGAFLAACDEDITVGEIDESTYETSEDTFGYLINNEGKRSMATVEFRDAGSSILYLGLSKDAKQNVSGKFRYNKAVLDAYNKAHETIYEAFPEELVTFAGDGAVALGTGESKSAGVAVSFVTKETLSRDVTYVIPVRAEVQAGGIQLSDEDSGYLLFVKDISKLPDCNKPTGIKIISCMEVNDTNPLNNLCFTLKNSEKPLVDMVILFSGNINYNNETGRVYVYNNPNVQHLLDNREKYLKPLQDRGMKIVLGILGNHDRSGVANLADETARIFARELKAVCDAYKLDGVFFDDEYSDYQTPPPPGFVKPSNNAAARLCYESKRAMPDKLICTYVYGATAYFPDPVDGVRSGEFIDYGIHDYGGGFDLEINYPGMPKSSMALYSQEFARESFAPEYVLKDLRDGGYGAHMIFAMDPNRSNFYRGQKPAMEKIAKVLFDDELVYDGKPYSKDW